jgi:RimJ/RimL family protein N-acetyltransferase
MQRSILSFDQDAESHWRAILACGHRQHVRHDPPLVARPWVLTDEGRASRIGEQLDCLKCDRDVIAFETYRLILRELRERDVPALMELDADPEVVRYVHLREPTTPERAREWIASVTARFYEGLPGFGFWAMIERDSGRFLGWFHLRPVDGDLTAAEIGYRLRRDAWGKGFATEVSVVGVRYAFEKMAASRVIASALVANRASTRVMEKAGMRPDRSFIEPITGADAVEYSLSRQEC